ncbi:MAG: thermonuclease family protein [Planctomycetes bacterium]|nr:thermonuclease family protein [Planctomycetota bacterium]
MNSRHRSPSSLALGLAALLAGALPALGRAQQAPAEAAPRVATALARVIDGDTLHVLRAGQLEKLRLLGVDTEEVRDSGPGSKPVTGLGRAASAHMKELLRCDEKGQPRADVPPATIELEFEGGVEERDTFGRLLCYAWFEGRNLNLHLVETGFSPYFTKYGYSGAHHAALSAAQERARAERRGIFGERAPGDAGRDYTAMLAWWNARADALRDAAAELARPEGWIDVRNAARLRERASASAGGSAELRTVFGAILAVRVERERVVVELEATTAFPCTVEWRGSPVELEAVLRLLRHASEGAANFITARGKLVVNEKAARVELTSLAEIELRGATKR